MKPNEKSIVKSLIAVAWADGKLEAPEQSMIDGLLWAFEADGDDEEELAKYAKKKRTLAKDLDLDGLSDADKELLLAHAALLTHADGEQTADEVKLLGQIVKRIGFSAEQAKPIIDEAKQRAARLAQKLG
jgi:tellurite resistance protein